MSCFETSIFLSNPDEHLLISVAKAACDALNWQYKQNANRLYITDVGQSTDLNGEYALAIIGNKLMKNNFYLIGIQTITSQDYNLMPKCY